MGLKKSVAIVILIVLAVFFGLRLLSPEDNWICIDGSWQAHGKPNSPQPTTPCLENPTTPTSTTTPTKTSINLKDYTNTKMGFSTKLPQDTEIKENLDGTISFYRWGPTQKTQTELYDGYSINIDQASLGVNKNLKSLIEADIEQKKEQLSPDFKIVAPISAKLNGFTYTALDAFGEVVYYYLPQANNKFLLISVISKDPGKLNFEKTVGDIILEITMIK